MTPRERAEICKARGHGSVRVLLEEIRLDVERFRREAAGYQPGSRPLPGVTSTLLLPAMQCQAIHRIAHHLYAIGLRGPSRVLSGLNRLLHKASIPPSTCVLGGLHLPHPAGSVLEAVAGRNLTLYAMSLVASAETAGLGGTSGEPRIGDDVTVAGHGAILGPVEVGSGVRVGLCSCLREDAPADSAAIARTYKLRRSGAELPESPEGGAET